MTVMEEGAKSQKQGESKNEQRQWGLFQLLWFFTIKKKVALVYNNFYFLCFCLFITETNEKAEVFFSDCVCTMLEANEFLMFLGSSLTR